MTVGRLMKLLAEFPPELPVFVRPTHTESVMVPRDAVMELTHPNLQVVLPEGDVSGTIPPGFADAVVIYPRFVRDSL